ncbi:MAG TPA: hypothetical protein VKJ47_13155, partial [Candidatus Binatia bacterium]|nr:hypothetical protein [Candidatus Binatia bacterium]
PPLAEEDPPTKIDERKIPRTAHAPAVSYLLKLPPEYHHGRSYPLLIVLHKAGESPRKMLERFADKAKEEGYILAAPNWARGGIGGDYGYSADEHDVVLRTLRDLRLRFNVDSDRVFLTGLGEGGDMAYDVGLSHPDLFAGVLPMSADPKYFIIRYWANAQYLPFYIVGGSHTGDPDKTTRKLFEKWIPHSNAPKDGHPGRYASLYVQYKGRGREWFGGELPSMFDWMNRKRRVTPIADLGRIGGDLGDEFASMRETDNHFYWLSGEISQRHVNQVPRWDNKIFPARLVGRLDPGTNQLFLYPTGYRNVTVWLARDAKIDFDKPLKVWVNGKRALGDQKVKPSLTVLLDDFAARGDRQKLFISRFDFRP